MITPKREDIPHLIQLYRLLTEILDNDYLSKNIYFKGGTCASMLGYLDRFSIDLDFDLDKNISKNGKKLIDRELKIIFKELSFEIKQKSASTLYYVLKYQSKPGLRNTIKLSLIDNKFKSNKYKPSFLKEIDRYAICQTIETMFGNKLVAVTDRYKKYRTIAGRDIYDIHYFFINGYKYNREIIKERTGKNTDSYLKELIKFIDKKVNGKVISEDLSFLLPAEKFQTIKKVLKSETLMFLKNEINNLA